MGGIRVFGIFSRKTQYKRKYLLPNGEDIEISVYFNEDDLALGQATWHREIKINGIIFKKLSKNAQDCIICHEYGHTKQPQALIWFVEGTLLVLSGLGFLHFLVLFVVINWASEIFAEFEAIKCLGIDNYKKALKEIKKKIKVRNFFKLISIILYPPRSLVIFLWQIFNVRTSKTH